MLRNTRRRACINIAINAGVFPFIPDASDLVYRPFFTDQDALLTCKKHPVMSNGLSLTILEKLRFILLPNHIYLVYPKAKERDPAVIWLCKEIEAAYEN